MKIYLRQLAAICMCAVAIACAQSASAQSLGEWQEPPGGYTWPLKAMHACLMPDKQILVWQGIGGSARLWDIGTGAFTCVPVGSAIFCSGHASLADGTLIIVGGGTIHSGSKETNFFCYGPCLGMIGMGPWRIGPDMASGRWYPTCTTLDDGRVLTVAGTNEDDEPAKFPEIYDPDGGGMWRTLGLAEKALPLYPYMFLLPDGNVFFAGPRSVAGEQLKTFVLIMDLEDEHWDELNPYITDYWAKDGSAVMYEPGKIMRIGGDTAGETLNTVELIDFNDPNPAWISDMINGGVATMQYARYDHQAVLLADGTVLVIGGKDSVGENITKPELYDPVANSWTNMADMSYPRYNHSIALLLPDGKVLSAGGDACNGLDSDDCGSNNGYYCTAEVFAPPYLFQGPRPEIGFAPTTISYILDFVVTLSTTSPVGNAEIAKVSLVRLGAMTHNFDQTSATFRWNLQQ